MLSASEDKFAGERAELASILASGIFDRSPNLHRFLAFVCEKYFRGESEEIKEYSVAVEALGRSEDFDQKRDSIVRVEAHRLRKRLDDYYKSSGAPVKYRISLPPGSYVPHFTRVADESLAGREAPAAPTESAAATPNRLSDAALAPAALHPKSESIFGGFRRLAVPGFVLLAVMVATAVWTGFNGSETESRAETVPPPAAKSEAAVVISSIDAASENGIRILAGSPLSSFVDRFGHTWTGDSYFTGGNAVESRLQFLHYTAVPELYAHRREGEFSYDIPMPEGSYELRLHFAEPIFGADKLAGGGETSRLFSIELNGKALLPEFDIVADTFGEYNAGVKVFKDVRPASDGKLHLRFVPGMHESPILSALEVVPSKPGKMNPVRIVASDRGFYDKNGNLWQADNYVHGGRTVRRNPVEGTGSDPNLFNAERYGNFDYMIPVATDGVYRVRIHFCERWWGPGTHAGGGAGSRIFDVHCNGEKLLSGFDVFKESGGTDKPIVREFTGIRPNAQGKLLISFIPQRNYAMVNAIEVIDESR